MTMKSSVTLAVLALAASLVQVNPAHAKGCGAKCRPEILACKDSCSSLTKKAKRTCIRDCKTPIIALCKERKNKTACSPSGAFLD